MRSPVLSYLGSAEVYYPKTSVFDEIIFQKISVSGNQFKVKASNQNLNFLNINSLTRGSFTSFGQDHYIKLSDSLYAENLIIYDPSHTESIIELDRIKFKPYSVHSTVAFICPQHLEESVNQYAEYRGTDSALNVQKIMIRELYNQFAYGIDGHPLSIKNFINHSLSKGTSLEHVFLIGKGKVRRNIKRNPELHRLLPTYGNPGSDLLLVSGPDRKTPMVGVGRLAANTNQEVLDYLEKVKLYESKVLNQTSYDDIIWTKKFLHLSAGTSPTEQFIIKTGLNTLESVLSQGNIAAEVQTITRQGTEVLERSLTDQIIESINKGVLVKTYFGHGSVTTTQFVLDNATQLDNFGKYPLMYSLGCNTGNVHTDILSASENLVLHPTLGAIGYIGSSGFGFINSLTILARAHYELLSQELYGAPIGTIMKESVSPFLNSLNIPIVLLREQLTYHGDPLIRLYHYKNPDFAFKPRSAKVNPSIIPATQDSFELSFIIANLGRQYNDRVPIRITQILPDGIEELLRLDSVQISSSEALFKYKLPVNFEAIGKNKILISIDPDDMIGETIPQGEANNSDQINFQILSNTARPVFPPDFGIVSSDSDIQLYASAFDGFLDNQKFRIEIDTNINFNSPNLYSNDLLANTALVTWNPPVEWQHEKVYFWRIGPLNLNDSIIEWSTSSFMVSDSIEYGWNQSHRDQFKQNVFQGLDINEPLDFEFRTRSNHLLVRNKIEDPATTAYWINSDRQDRQWVLGDGRMRTGVHISVIDPNTIIPWINPYGAGFGSVNQLDSTDRKTFPYETKDSSSIDSILNFLIHVIPDGHYVLFHTVQWRNNSYLPENWFKQSPNYDMSLVDFLEGQGATEIGKIKQLGSVPYIFLFRKNGEVLSEQLASSVDEWLELSLDLEGIFDQGSMQTHQSFQLKSINQVEWSAQNITESDQDSIRIYLGSDGMNVIDSTLNLRETLDGFNLEADNLSGHLNLSLKDSIDYTASDLRYWRMIGRYYPDIAIKSISPVDKILEDIDTLSFEISVLNLNLEDINENIPYRISLTTEKNDTIEVNASLSGLPTMQNVLIPVRLPVEFLSGPAVFEFEINPEASSGVRESNYFNNRASKIFTLNNYIPDPILDVSFNGKSIEFQEVIAPTSVLEVSLSHANPRIIYDDPSIIEVAITDPDGIISIYNVANGNADFTFNSERSKLTILGKFFKDGIYSMTAMATRKKTPAFDKLKLETAFRIDTRENISEITLFPNPLSDKLFLECTVTGTATPEEINVEVFNIEGQLVLERKINPSIGRNQIVIDGQRWSVGSYVLQIISNNQDLLYEKKVMKIR